ncbi:uncharacterized protein [Watersipora subatra]|uniref:uncharacterized protein n=1 Tax=Watersipora subatra TaxID=2589382 RepID=UPI00355BE1FD
MKPEFRCAETCLADDGCVGFLHNNSQSSCSLFGCFNPEEEASIPDGGSQAYVMIADHLLARGKNVSMSSVYLDDSGSQAEATFHGGAFAVDGIYEPPADNEIFSLANSLRESKPWLRVNLQKVHCIWAVRILNRVHAPWPGIVARLRDLIITAAIWEDDILYHVNPDSLCGQHDGKVEQAYLTVTCLRPMRARFVQIQINDTEILNIYELEVHGFKRL